MVNWRVIRLMLILLAGFVFLVACGNNAPLAAGEQVVLVCSEECAARGQCGSLSDGTKAILGQDSGPIIRGHNRFFIEGAVVNIDETTNRDLVSAVNGVPVFEAIPFTHTFYRVTQPELLKTAWVSGWCIVRP
jgi:hypothetical protein